MATVNVHNPLTASVATAEMKLLACVKEPSIEIVTLEDAASRVLACDFESPIPLPPFRRAAMDGYAVRSEALEPASRDKPVRLRVIGEIKAGPSESDLDTDSGALPTDAVRIFTGAPVPCQYDTVIMQEAAVRLKRNNEYDGIQLDRNCTKGQHIAEKGEDIPEGMKLLSKGTYLRAKEIGLLASVGQMTVTVYKRPAVALVPIGDELAMPGTILAPGQIYDANSFMIGARLRELGASVIRFPKIADCMATIVEALEDTFACADIVVTTGGVSVGDYDFVKQAAERIGAVPIFTKTIMRPGTPTSAFHYRGKLLVCLSGNPSACFAGMELLLKAAVMKAAGRTDYRSRWMEGRLMESVAKPCPYPRYARAYAYRSEKEWMVEPLRNDKSGNVAAFAKANALVLIPPGGSGAVIGQEVQWVSL